MKIFLANILLLFFPIILSAQDIVIEQPSFSVRNHRVLEIEKIVLKDDATVFHITGYFRPNNWIRIASDTYIRANDKKYTIQSADGIILDKEESVGETGRRAFTLTFPAIDKNTDRIDFIESDCDNCFKTWGIELKSKVLTNRIEVPQAIKDAAVVKDDGKPLENILKDEDAILKIYALGYQPGMNLKMKFFFQNPVIGSNEQLEAIFSDNGYSEIRIPIVATTEIPMEIRGLLTKNVLLSPGQETSLYIDLQQKACQEAISRIDKCKEAQYVYFVGANAGINNEMNNTEIDKIINEFANSIFKTGTIAGMSANEYKAHITNQTDNAIAKISTLELSRKTKEYLTLKAKYTGIYNLLLGRNILEQAYRQWHHLDIKEKLTGYTNPVFDKNYYSFLKDSPINDPVSFYNSTYYGNIILLCGFLKPDIGIMRFPDMADKFEKFPNLSADDLETIRFLKKKH